MATVVNSLWRLASVADDVPAVIAAVIGEAERCDPGHKREWAVLIDGNNTQIAAVIAEAARRDGTVTIIIDSSRCWNPCGRPHGPFLTRGEPATEKWVAAQARKILHGNAAQAAAGIRRRAYAYSGPERAGAD